MQSITPPEIMERALADLQPDDDEPETDALPAIFREGYLFVSGRREGLAEGRDTLRRVLVDILHTRGITVSASAHRRIEECEDVATIARWCAKASSLSGPLGEAELAAFFESPER